MGTDPSHLCHLLFYPVLFVQPAWESIPLLLLLVIMLMCSAFASASEVAFFSLSHNDISQLEHENSLIAKRIVALTGKPRELLATILITNNFVNIAIVIVSDLLLTRLVSFDMFRNWSLAISDRLSLATDSVDTLARGIEFSINVIGVAFLILLFGEVAPKIYARVNNIKLARIMAAPLMVLSWLFSPLSLLLIRGSAVVERRLERRTLHTNITSREELEDAIDLTVQGDTNENEADILKRIVQFGDVSVRQIMRSRMDVVAVDFRTSYQELLSIVKDSGFSRIPVYDEDLDNITGILYAKDLIDHLFEPDDFEWQPLIRTEVLYVPESKLISDLLKEFQKVHLHMAIVVDEYGGSAGIVTLEDIMEEVIGEIRDEFDDEVEVEYKKIDDFTYIFEGKTLLNDVCRVIGVDTYTFDDIRGDADSLAGLILELVGHFPKKDAEISWSNYTFKIITVNKRRIEQIQLVLPR